jgi:hypothetical protein
VPVEADRWTDSRCLREIGFDRLGVFEAVDQGVNRAAADLAQAIPIGKANLQPVRPTNDQDGPTRLRRIVT